MAPGSPPDDPVLGLVPCFFPPRMLQSGAHFYRILSVASDAPVRGTGLTPGRSSPGASAVLHSSPDAPIRGAFLSYSLRRSLHCRRPCPRVAFPASCSALRLCLPSPGRSSPCDGCFCCPFPSGPLPDVPLRGETVHPSCPHICRILIRLRAIRRSLCSSPSLCFIPVSPPDRLGRQSGRLCTSISVIFGLYMINAISTRLVTGSLMSSARASNCVSLHAMRSWRCSTIRRNSLCAMASGATVCSWSARHTLKEVTSSLNNLRWHIAGDECLAEASVEAVHEVPVPPDIHVLYQDWSRHYAKDKVYKQLWAELKTTEYVDDPKRNASFLLQKGKIFHQGKVCAPKAILSKGLAAVHSYAHPGIDKTEQCFHRRFKALDARYNPVSVSDACHSLVHSCAVCQQTRPRRGRQPDTLDSTPGPEHIFHSVSVDFVELPDCPAKNGIVYDYALCVVCRLTGYVVAILCVKKGLCRSVARTAPCCQIEITRRVKQDEEIF